MLPREWLKLIDAEEMSEKEWETVHRVYQTHPLIGEVKGKQDLLALYKLGGMGLIESMVPDADTAARYEEIIRGHDSRIANFKEQIKQVETKMAQDVFEFKAWKARFRK